MATEQTSEGKALFFQNFKKIEIAIFIVSVVVLLLKFSNPHLPLNSFLIVSMGSMAMYSFLFAFSGKVVYDVKNNVLLIIANVACSILSIGILFSILFWPGGGLHVRAGVLLSLVSLVWISVTAGNQVFGLGNFYNKVLLVKLSFLFLVAAWFIFTPPIDIYKQVNSHGNDPIAVRLYEEHINDPQSKAKRDAYREYVRIKK